MRRRVVSGFFIDAHKSQIIHAERLSHEVGLLSPHKVLRPLRARPGIFEPREGVNKSCPPWAPRDSAGGLDQTVTDQRIH